MISCAHEVYFDFILHITPRVCKMQKQKVNLSRDSLARFGPVDEMPLAALAELCTTLPRELDEVLKG